MSHQEKIAMFKKLHEQNTPLLLGNVWNAHSAKLAEKAGFQALGSSSHAIAFALGYPDGEAISIDEILFVLKRIVASVAVPISVDFEAGYSNNPKEVAQNVKKLTDLGIVGINLEDGIVQDGKRVLSDAQLTIDKIKAIKSETDVFINARVDTYTTKHPQALEESIKRALAYQEAGADGIFVPLIETTSDLEKFVKEVRIPLNVFTTPLLPDYETLGKLGVKRISHGAKQYDQLMKKSEELFTTFQQTKAYGIMLG